MNTYQFRSHMIKSNGTIAKSNIGSRPYVNVNEVIADDTLNNNDRRCIHDFINDKWYIVVNGWLTTMENSSV